LIGSFFWIPHKTLLQGSPTRRELHVGWTLFFRFLSALTRSLQGFTNFGLHSCSIISIFRKEAQECSRDWLSPPSHYNSPCPFSTSLISEGFFESSFLMTAEVAPPLLTNDPMSPPFRSPADCPASALLMYFLVTPPLRLPSEKQALRLSPDRPHCHSVCSFSMPASPSSALLFPSPVSMPLSSNLPPSELRNS